MDRSVFPTNRKPEETAGNRSQLEMSLIGEVPRPQFLDMSVVRAASFNGCLQSARLHCGLDDQQLAKKMHISKGYMSKFLNGVADCWVRRFIGFMRITGSLAPLQWIANQMGCDLVNRSELTRERDELLARMADLERRERMVA